ncbi:MAG: hypothetical protein IJ408_02285 [Clostridia bacterium]|nr:hypothetical protein [Clostridia bacterium]
MKKFIKKFKEYKYKKRLGKWLSVNLRFGWRKLLRALRSPEFIASLKGPHAIIAYLSVFVMVGISVGMFALTSVSENYFDRDARAVRRLSISGRTDGVPYLEALSQFGSTNRIQIELKTEKDNHLRPIGTGLEKGGVNLVVRFNDGAEHQYVLNNAYYDNFREDATDSFTVILPFGYTPFDVESYSLAVRPDIKGNFGTWHCAFARVYFLLENEPVMLAKENWEGKAIFGAGEDAVKESKLENTTADNDSYKRTENIYKKYLKLADASIKSFDDTELRSDTLESLGLSGGRTLLLDIETVSLENQNSILTYYTKGTSIEPTDDLDYDGLMYLDVTFYTPLPDGSFSKSYLLDTLGTDDFELGCSSSFSMEMPEGKTVFDINTVSLRVDNPYDAWAPRYVRLYIKPDYTDRLELARFNDSILVNGYSTPVFYKGLIEGSVELDLTASFRISDTIRKEIEKQHRLTFSGKLAEMYFDLLSFYDRQEIFFDKMVSLYSPNAYEPETEIALPETLPPETEQQEEEQPEEQPEEEQQPEEQPETPPAAVIPDPTPQPETQTPETQTPETKPETQTPETQQPETEQPETQTPETQTPETQQPETETPETETPETETPEPETPEPETDTTPVTEVE